MAKTNKALNHWKQIRMKLLAFVYMSHQASRNRKPKQKLDFYDAVSTFYQRVDNDKKWWVNSNFVFDPRTLSIIVIQAATNVLFLVWWIVFTLRLAYSTQSGNLENLNWIEHWLDAVFLFDIVFTFFVGIPVDETSIQAKVQCETKTQYNSNMAEIALKYLKSTLLPDLFSFFPKIFGWGSSMYLLKGIRILHLLKDGN